MKEANWLIYACDIIVCNVSTTLKYVQNITYPVFIKATITLNVGKEVFVLFIFPERVAFEIK